MEADSINTSLELTISRVRLEKYLVLTNGNLGQAIELYKINFQLSESLYTSLQGLEICLRNTLNLQISNCFSNNWLLEDRNFLQYTEKEEINNLLSKTEVDLSHDDLVAKLKFSFWVGLLGPRYDNSLWRSALYKGFKATTGKSRKDVHRRMNALRRFRNRVAHHEPIINASLRMHNEAIETIEWMCRDTGKWIANCSRFHNTYKLLPKKNAEPIQG